MRSLFLVAALLIITVSSNGQITADNGLTSPDGTKVQLGGTLLQNTYIDLGSSHDFHFKKDGTYIFSMLNNGNIGIGKGDPGARLSFANVDNTVDPVGITWYSPNPTICGIHRTAGPWTGPDYQQLRLGWNAGIIMDPGTGLGKSFVDIKGDGLRVTSGNIGIGTTTPHSKLEVGASAADDASPNQSQIWDAYSARFNNGNVSIFSSGDVNTAGDSYQLNFYARYHDGTMGKITSKAAYMKGSVTTVRVNEASPWSGQGTLVLGSTNTSYTPSGFTDVPAMYVRNGQVGVGVVTPEAQLHTTGTVRFAGLANDNNQTRVIVSDANGNLTYRDAATLGGSGTGWTMSGNSGTNPSANFIGTTDASDLVFKTNGSQIMRMMGNTGNMLVNKFEDNGYKFQVAGNGSLIGPIGSGVALILGDNVVNKAFGIVTYGDVAGNDRYTVIGHNMWEGSMYNTNKQGGGIYLDDRNSVLPIRFMIKKVGEDPSTYAAGISAAGNFLIGNTADQAGYKLQVNGNIRTRKVRVDQETWADYVFNNDYQLRSLKEVEQYIQQEKHLPDVPSAAEVKKEGLDLGDNQAILLKKIEELTLYVIQQQKQLEAQQQKIDVLEKKVGNK